MSSAVLEVFSANITGGPEELIKNRNGLSDRLMLAFLGFMSVVILLEIKYRLSHTNKCLKNMPTAPRLPLIGHLHILWPLRNNADVVREALKYFAKYRHGYAMLFYYPIVFVTAPEDIEVILSSQVHLEKSKEYDYFKPWFGNGLLISSGDHWRLHRKMIAPTFHQSILKSFMPKFVHHSNVVVGRLSEYIGKEFDVHHDMSQAAVEILMTTVMGVKKLPAGADCARYAKAVLDMCDIIHNRQLKPYQWIDALFNRTAIGKHGKKMLATILRISKYVVDHRQAMYNKDTDSVLDESSTATVKKDGLRDDLDDIDESVGTKRRLALLDAMLEMKADPDIKWNEKDIFDEVSTIMFEGHDTTAAGSSFVLCMLGVHKDVQAKVMEEQARIFSDDIKRDCTFADTLEMNYLERVIKETLRVFPPVPVISRKVATDVKLPSGNYSIPAGATVVVSPYAAHRCARTYPDPEKFDPDNFLPERVSQRHYYSWIPFSAGPRSCVGRKYAMLMLKVLLSTIVRNFEVDCTSNDKNFQLQGDIILKMANGFNISLQARA